MDGGKRHEQRGTIMIVVRQRRHVLTSTPHGTASLLCPTYTVLLCFSIQLDLEPASQPKYKQYGPFLLPLNFTVRFDSDA
jgi:hypothetical protein